MFDFLFKKNKDNLEQQSKKNNILASITYYISENTSASSVNPPTPMIDISMGDYSDKSTTALCELLDVLSKDACYLETLEMIKNGLIQDKQEEVLIKIFTHISEQAGKKITKVHKESSQDQPCIKPLDMLK